MSRSQGTKEIGKMTTEDYLNMKWEMIFAYLDVNRDAILDKKELFHFKGQLEKEGKHDFASMANSIYTGLWNRLSEALRLPVNHPGFSREQFVKGVSVIRGTDWFNKEFTPTLAELLFESMDRNHDGSISLGEWRAYQGKRKMYDEGAIQSTFSKMDRDGDGRISRDEVKHAVVQFNVGEDQSDDYSFLYAIN